MRGLGQWQSRHASALCANRIGPFIGALAPASGAPRESEEKTERVEDASDFLTLLCDTHDVSGFSLKDSPVKDVGFEKVHKEMAWFSDGN